MREEIVTPVGEFLARKFLENLAGSIEWFYIFPKEKFMSLL